MIADINRLIVDKKASVFEITNEYIARINNKDKALNSFISYNFENALSKAREIDSKLERGEKIPLLGGIPMSVKDNISVKGMKMSCASKMLDNYYPPYTASAFDALCKDGAILLGKNNMDEFGLGSTGETSYYGPSINPLDNRRVAGGSSSGGACAVASDMAVYALCSDTGGSVRLPASYCGCVGFKPTYGAVSRYGLTAYASSFDQIGIITKSAEDAICVFDTIAFKDPKDMTSHSVSQMSEFSLSNNDLKGVRIGVDWTYIDIADIDIKNSISAFVDVLKGLGAEVLEIKLPPCDDVLASYYIIACAQLASNLSRYDGVRYGYRAECCQSFDDMVTASRSEAFGDEVKKRIILGNMVLSKGYKDRYYTNALNCRNTVIRHMDDVFTSADIILTPTSPNKVPLLGAVRASIDDMYRMDIYTVLANLCSIPAISLPFGNDNENMPFGVQLMSRENTDRYLLRISDIIEKNISSGGGKNGK